MRRTLFLLAAGIAAACASGAASAHVDVGLYFDVPGPVYAAPPVYVPPPRVVYRAPAVVYEPRPVYYGRYRDDGWRDRWHDNGWHRGWWRRHHEHDDDDD